MDEKILSVFLGLLLFVEFMFFLMSFESSIKNILLHILVTTVAAIFLLLTVAFKE